MTTPRTHRNSRSKLFCWTSQWLFSLWATTLLHRRIEKRIRCIKNDSTGNLVYGTSFPCISKSVVGVFIAGEKKLLPPQERLYVCDQIHPHSGRLLTLWLRSFLDWNRCNILDVSSSIINEALREKKLNSRQWAVELLFEWTHSVLAELSVINFALRYWRPYPFMSQRWLRRNWIMTCDCLLQIHEVSIATYNCVHFANRKKPIETLDPTHRKARVWAVTRLLHRPHLWSSSPPYRDPSYTYDWISSKWGQLDYLLNLESLYWLLNPWPSFWLLLGAARTMCNDTTAVSPYKGLESARSLCLNSDRSPREIGFMSFALCKKSFTYSLLHSRCF